MSHSSTPVSLARLEARAARDETQRTHLHLDPSARTEQLIAANKALTLSLFGAEQRIGELLKLVVVMRRLFETQSGRDALLNLEEILVTVLGTEDYAILACQPDAAPRVLAAMGEAESLVQGTPEIADYWLSEDALRAGDVVRVTPLEIGGREIGAIVVRRLLAHRVGLDGFDAEVLAVISELAATAILAADHRSAWATLRVAGA